MDVGDAAARLLPGVNDIPGNELLFKATMADGPGRLTALEMAELEQYQGLSLHGLCNAAPELACKVHRAVSRAA